MRYRKWPKSVVNWAKHYWGNTAGYLEAAYEPSTTPPSMAAILLRMMADDFERLNRDVKDSDRKDAVQRSGALSKLIDLLSITGFNGIGVIGALMDVMLDQSSEEALSN